MHTYIIMLGLPGAGKGTQARRLAERWNLFWISTGDVLRRIAVEGHALAERVRRIMERGDLVDDATVFEVVHHYLETEKTRYRGAILDGFPRNLRQAEMLDGYLEENHRAGGLHAVLMELDEAVVIRRLTSRRVCPACQRVYNLLSRPSKAGNQCEACGAELIQRDDDAEPVIRRRLQTYQEATAPLVAYYETRGKLVRVPAAGAEDEVFAELSERVRRWLQADPETGSLESGGWTG